ncbi:helix-turn-helix domain-containing protein [Hymenobacter metallicola]|uniref:Uncharacterized protein n=1 Tax=Hymenobacter metallicola TaxID=2563114 RepID=A0A4Z0QIB2_9BACT|nr:hypothetical protein [Hymenobacter metallicola]TGE29818.1 hypothetical protein E5K02_10265 [Hymenobacter metallicola]
MNNKLPPGAQADIARVTGLSRQAVSKVLQGKFKNEQVSQLAEEYAARYATQIRVGQFRLFINNLSDEALATYLK